MAAPKAFITGIAGFAGSHLAEELLEHGWSVTGSVLRGESRHNLKAIKNDIELVTLDILNEKSCREKISAARPTHIFHLAAFASVGKSFEMDRQAYRINIDGTLNMLRAAMKAGNLERFLYVSSADCYGVFSPTNKTLSEEESLNPVSPYAISKVAAEQICRFYHGHHAVPIVIARSFNHSGPRQSDAFVIPSFSKRIAAIEAGLQKPILQVGNLSARRDLSDVRDIVRGYRLMAQKGKVGRVYNLCSGRAVSIQSVLKQLLALSESNIKVVVEKKRLRKVDIPVLRGDNRKASKDLGFKLRYSLRTTLKDSLDYWRKNLKHG